MKFRIQNFRTSFNNKKVRREQRTKQKKFHLSNSVTTKFQNQLGENEREQREIS